MPPLPLARPSGGRSPPGAHTTDRGDGDGDGETETIPDAVPTRRAMVRAAVAGVDTFKKSWISVMLLKSSVGLGQVIALLTLLVLAATLDSPLYPGTRQSAPSPACPRPQLFQAWIGANLCRLTVCWAVSCWTCVRRNAPARDPAGRDEERAVVDADPIRRATHTVPRSDTVPSLSFSAASASTATLDGPSGASPPARSHDPLDSPPASTASHDRLDSPPASTLGHSADLLSACPVAGKTDQRACPPRFTPATETYGTPGDVPVSTDRPILQAARDMHAGRPVVPGEQRADSSRPGSSFAAWLDRWALTISKTLGLISAVLFVLGNLLVFYPSPAHHQTCYHAAPLLWWGVMTVLGVGWILLSQLFFVVLIVGLGGRCVFAALRRIGLLAPLPRSEPARAPLPDALSPSELAKLQLVVYVPEPPLAGLEHKEELGAIPPWPSSPPTDLSRLRYPPVHLPSHRATCAICQEAFEPPKEGRSIMLKAPPLRRLGCGHVYHTGCIDEWLLKGHGNCPFCNRSVRDFWDAQSVDSEVAGHGKQRWFRASLGER